MLLGGFILNVVTQLDFAHSDHLTASHSFGGIQNLNWPFAIGQISA
jgi:hypothetical protein